MDTPPDFSPQAAFGLRLDWGARGLTALAPLASAVVIVDVLSFGTAVDVACARGARVLPWPLHDDSALRHALDHGAMLAQRRGTGGYTLSPHSLRAVPQGTALVLPSPNGSALVWQAQRLAATLPQPMPVLAACLRNAGAVAAWLHASVRGPVAVIAAGERWPDGSLRPALEDLLGAGAVVAALAALAGPHTDASPEARAAAAAFRERLDDLALALRGSASGQELAGRAGNGHGDDDVALAAALDASAAVPLAGPYGLADAAAP